MNNQNQQPDYQPNQQQPQYQQPQYQQPQQPYYQPNYAQSQQRPPKPDNYLVWAILSTLLCCLPLGVVSIVYAAKVDGLYNSGDYNGAQDASNKAKQFATWSAISAVIIIVIYLLAAVVLGVAGNM